MAIEIDNVTYRNLEEQVQYLTDHIKGLSFGLRIKGKVDSVSSLPFNAELGDCYIVGTYFYIKTSSGTQPGDWTLYDLKSQIPGPKGAPGEDGERGLRGSRWKVGGIAPTGTAADKDGDMYLNINTGDVYQFNVNLNEWRLYGSIKGPVGLIGNTGRPGPIGPKGDKGNDGENAYAFTIVGIIADSSALPTPDVNKRHNAYLVGVQSPYELWVQVGPLEGPLSWKNLGPIATNTIIVNGADTPGSERLKTLQVGETHYHTDFEAINHLQDHVDRLQAAYDDTVQDVDVNTNNILVNKQSMATLRSEVDNNTHKILHNENDVSLAKGDISTIKSDYCSLTGGTVIPGGADLNTYTTVGNYFQSIGGVEPPIINVPIGTTTLAFTLKVINSIGYESESYITQLFNFAYNGAKYIRVRYGSTDWLSWQKVTTESDLSVYAKINGTQTITASGFIKSGGTASEVLMADGSTGVYKTKTSELTNDSGFITSSALPIVGHGELTLKTWNGTTEQEIGTFSANATSNKVIRIPIQTSGITAEEVDRKIAAAIGSVLGGEY